MGENIFGGGGVLLGGLRSIEGILCFWWWLLGCIPIYGGR